MPRRRKRDDVDGLWPPDAKPSWQDYFSDEDLAALKKTLKIRSKKSSEYFRAVLPLLIVRYQRARTGEEGNSLKIRRQRLKSIANQAEKLRMSLLALEDPARLDFLAEASHKTGSAFSIDAIRPDQWLSDQVDQVIRDVLISARSAEKSLKKNSVRGGRPRHAAERLLIWDLAALYQECTGKAPVHYEKFRTFAHKIFAAVDPQQDNSGLDDLIEEIVSLYRSELAENR